MPRFAWRGLMLDSAQALPASRLHPRADRLDGPAQAQCAALAPDRRPGLAARDPQVSAADTSRRLAPTRRRGLAAQSGPGDRQAAALRRLLQPGRGARDRRLCRGPLRHDRPGNRHARPRAGRHRELPATRDRRRSAGRLVRLGRARLSVQCRGVDARVSRGRASRSDRAVPRRVRPYRRRRSGQGSLAGIRRACRRASASSGSPTKRRCRAGSSRASSRFLDAPRTPADRLGRNPGKRHCRAHAAIMSWRGTEGASRGGARRARRRDDAVARACISIICKATRRTSPRDARRIVSLADVYAFEPVPPELAPAEAAPHPRRAGQRVDRAHAPAGARRPTRSSRAQPRIAEVTWSPAAARDWSGFQARLPRAVRALSPARNRARRFRLRASPQRSRPGRRRRIACASSCRNRRRSA